jgi:hypothetical protein
MIVAHKDASTPRPLTTSTGATTAGGPSRHNAFLSAARNLL